jgi:preprotein translocase subunit SecA
MSFLSNIFGDKYAKAIKPFWSIVAEINALEEGIKALSDVDLKAKTAEFKKKLLSVTDGGEGKTLEDILPEAYAVVREASRRTLSERHFDVQLIGGIILNKGGIAEMRTGEGKTLVATLPAYLNALSGHGVHIVTVNDYLSRRDAVWMGQVYDFLGLSVGIINHESSFLYDSKHISDKTLEEKEDKERDELGSFKVVYDFLKPCTRREAYGADITYGTNNEFGFDYLRDNIEYAEKDLRQREYNFAIVDEVDSILIDEARTPLIISAPTTESGDLYIKFADIVKPFKKDEDFTVDEKLKAIQLTDAGISKAEKSLGLENIYTDAGIKYVHHLETATRAKALFEKDTDYVVKDDEIIIVDEFTGRLQPGRRWSEGLHQAIEAKEGVKIQKESRTFASITFQNYFRLYKKLSGMTGTALTSEEEFYKVYHAETFSIPTNKDIKRMDKNDLIFQTENGKFIAVAKQVKELQKKGQPVLIGTVSIEKNEILSAYLSKEGVKHNVLNAKNHEKEGEIVAQAGHFGGVTVATNMAGRGVDIKLGGVPYDKEKAEEVKALGGLCVIGTERHDARRIDNQLRGRAGRQGDPGETQFYVSLEDSLMRIFASDTIKKLMGRFGLAEDQAIENSLITKSLETAQTKIEGFNFDARKHVLEYDDVLNYQRKLVYERRRAVLLGDNEMVKTKLDEVINDHLPSETRDSSLEKEEISGKPSAAVIEGIDKIIADKIALMGEEEFYRVAKILLLQSIDMFWVDHLEIMDYTRSSVNLRAYGQRDPLVEYKKEGLRLFREMNEAVNDQILKILPNIGAGAYQRQEQELKDTQKHMVLAGGGTEDKEGKKQNTVVVGNKEEKVGRNDACPCGSGKKYKKCHGA